MKLLKHGNWIDSSNFCTLLICFIHCSWFCFRRCGARTVWRLWFEAIFPSMRPESSTALFAMLPSTKSPPTFSIMSVLFHWFILGLIIFIYTFFFYKFSSFFLITKRMPFTHSFHFFSYALSTRTYFFQS